MSMAFRTCPECRWNKVGHYCGKQMTLNGFECINYDKKEKKKKKGKGKHKGTLGKIICNYKGFEIGEGSGFSEAMRDEIRNNQDK